MILAVFLLALTVPSLPSPYTTARTVLGDSVSKVSSTRRLRCVTSSAIPTVKWGRGSSTASSSRAARAMAGVNSLDESPYRPPITRGLRTPNRVVPDPAASSASAVTTSWYSGSPCAPGSFVRSSTAIASVLDGSESINARPEKGRNRRTFTNPTRSPDATSASTASSAAPHPEPIITITRSAFGWPT